MQADYLRANGVGTSAILNAGASTIWGAEIDGHVLLSKNLSINFSYAYLNTEVDELVVPPESEWPPGIRWSGTSSAEGEPLSYTPEHQLVLSDSYHLPVSERIGEIMATLSYIYTDDMQASAKEKTPYYRLPYHQFDR